MTVNQAKYRRKDHPALTATCLQSSAFQGNFLWFGGDFIEQIWAALEVSWMRRKRVYSILLWTDRRDSWFSHGSFFPPLQTGSWTIRIPCRENFAQRKMGALCPHSRTVTSYLCKSPCVREERQGTHMKKNYESVYRMKPIGYQVRTSIGILN